MNGTKKSMIAFILCAIGIACVEGCEKVRKITGTGSTPSIEEKEVVPDGDLRNATVVEMSENIKRQNNRVVDLSSQTMIPLTMVRKTDQLMELERVEEMRRAFRDAGAAAHALDETTLQLERNLKHAANAYRAAAQGYLDRAEDYTDPKFKAACLGWANLYAARSDRCPKHRERLAALRAEIPATILLIRESGKLLDDYHMFIKTSAGEVIPEEVTKANTEAIKNYAEQFSSFESAIRTYQQPEYVAFPGVLGDTMQEVAAPESLGPEGMR